MGLNYSSFVPELGQYSEKGEYVYFRNRSIPRVLCWQKGGFLNVKLVKLKSTPPLSIVMLLCEFKIKTCIHFSFYESVSAAHSKVMGGSGEKKGRRKSKISRTCSSRIHANCNVMLIFFPSLETVLDRGIVTIWLIFFFAFFFWPL